MSHTTPVIHVRNLTKTFGKVRALDGLDLTVRPGEVHGFLGANRAGKSTTIRILLGLMQATAGHVELFGADPWRDAAGCTGDWPTWPGTSHCGPA